jgi:hypothetical protein
VNGITRPLPKNEMQSPASRIQARRGSSGIREGAFS